MQINANEVIPTHEKKRYNEENFETRGESRFRNTSNTNDDRWNPNDSDIIPNNHSRESKIPKLSSYDRYNNNDDTNNYTNSYKYDTSDRNYYDNNNNNNTIMNFKQNIRSTRNTLPVSSSDKNQNKDYISSL